MRLEKLFGDDMPDSLFYWQCDRPLPQMIDVIRRVIREHKIDYVVVDSIAYACGGDAESSEIASRYKVATQAFGVGSLHLAHVPKNGDTNKPFGSAYWHNGARSTWYLEQHGKPETRNGVTETALKWHHRKNNLGPKEQQPRVIRFMVDDHSNRILVSASGTVAESSKPTIEDQVRRVLANGSKTREELQAALPDIKGESLKKTLSRGLKPGKGKQAWLREQADRIALIDSRAQAA